MINSWNDCYISVKEHDEAMEKGFEEAFQIIQAEKERNEQLERDLYEEYDKKLKDVREFMITQVDKFLDEKYVEAGGDIVALREKYTGEKVVTQALSPQEEEYEARIKILEARIMRLQMENTKLENFITEQSKVMGELASKTKAKYRSTVCTEKGLELNEIDQEVLSDLQERTNKVRATKDDSLAAPKSVAPPTSRAVWVTCPHCQVFVLVTEQERSCPACHKDLRSPPASAALNSTMNSTTTNLANMMVNII